MVKITIENGFETGHCFFNGHKLAFETSEHLGHKERLRQETLNLAGTRHSKAVDFTEFIKTKNGDDVLKFFVALQVLLHITSHLVVTLAHYLRRENR